MMKKISSICLTLIVALSVMFAWQSPVNAKAPKVESVEYKGNGRVEMEFYGKVKYKNTKVTVRDTSGKKYGVKKIYRDNDEIKFTIKNYKKGKTYKFTVSGIKKKGTKGYGKRTRTVKIPKATTGANISREKALQIAKKHAASSFKTTKFWDIDVDRDTYRGQSVWEVSFNAKSGNKVYEYDYDIAVKGGKILKYDRELDD